MSQLIGPLCFKLQQKEDLHIKYEQQLLTFYKTICVHKSDECRENAVYNLPAMNQIYRQRISNH